MRLKVFLFGVVCFGLWASCDQMAILNENKPIGNKVWLYTSPVSFKFRIDDKTKKYDVFIDVRHTPEYAFSNIFLLVHQHGPDRKRYTFRKEIKLAKSDGKWTGKSSGSLYNNQSLIHKDFLFPDTGLYTISVEQNMRENPLKEITDIGLTIIPK